MYDKTRVRRRSLKMNKKELQEKIYSMSNSFLPLDMFYNDIRDNPIENYDKEQAYKDIEKIANFILDLQKQLKDKDKRIAELEQTTQTTTRRKRQIE